MTPQLLYNIIIGHSESAPIKGRELAKRLGISERKVRELVSLGVKQSMRIGSSGIGYFWLETAEQAERMYNRLRKHSLSQLSHANSAKRLFKTIRQEELELA